MVPTEPAIYSGSYTASTVRVSHRREYTMAMKLSTTISHINDILNPVNASLVKDFYHYLKEIGTSENYQNQNIKQIIGYAKSLGPETFYDIQTKEEIISFLDTKIKDTKADPDKKSITTWNDYLWRIKYFYRWLYNYKLVHYQGNEPSNSSDWNTPSFVSIKKKKTKRLSPYLETELWEKDDLMTIIKYESYARNKAILSLLWDLDARPHEITLLKIKHIRIRENYGEGEISFKQIFFLHFLNGSLAGIAFPFILSILDIPITKDVLMLSVAYGFILWLVTLVPIHQPVTGYSIWNHQLGHLPSVASLVGHLIYGLVLGIVIMIITNFSR